MSKNKSRGALAVVLLSAAMVFSTVPIASGQGWGPVDRAPQGIDSGAAASKATDDVEAGGPGADIAALEEAVSEVIYSYPDDFAGAEYALDYSSLKVHVKNDKGDGASALKAVMGKFDNRSQVVLVPASYSMAELMAVADGVDLDAITGATSIGPDIPTNSILLGVDTKVAGAPATGTTKLGKVAGAGAASKAGVVSDIPVRVIEAESSTPDVESRNADSGPYFRMGIPITNSTGRCSLGVPVVVKGTFMALTAGHCGGTSYVHNGQAVGTQYTSTYPGNADIYGDWKLISGQHYNLRVWSGGPTGTQSLPITGARWTPQSVGASACSSGSTTGQICRYKVTAINQRMTLDGVSTGHLTTIRHDGDFNGSYDCSGWRPGDSGGTVYYSDNQGGVIAAGIVTASTKVSPCYYRYTQLSGLRAFDAGAKLG